MTRRAKASHASGFTVMLVDDNADYLQATRLLLERDGHHVLTATNGPEALSILPQQPVDLLLLDYFMPGMTGEQVVDELRKFDPFVQVILQTGYASEQPPRELLQRLNIQGYYDKTEGPEQLLLWTAVGLKAAATTQLLFRTRRALGCIAEMGGKLQRAASTGELLQQLLVEVTALAGSVLDGSPVDSLVATFDGGFELQVRAGSGRFAKSGRARDVCSAEVLGAIEAGLAGAELAGAGAVFPFFAGGQTWGALYLDRAVHQDYAREAFAVLAQQAATLMQSARLAELAPVNLLTGTQARRGFDLALLRELRAALRARVSLALALVDIDGLAAINARAGRAQGDRALQAVAAALTAVSRGEDVLGRYDGDTFAMLLRNASPEGPLRIAARVAAELTRAGIGAGRDQTDELSVCIGYAALPAPAIAGELGRTVSASYFASLAELMRATAASALGEAQRAGRGVVRGGMVNWPTL